MKKIYIAGCGGMLGEAIYNVFKKNYILKCTDIDLNENWLTYLDFRDYQKYYSEIKNFEPNLLIHLGALTNLEYCENNKDITYASNIMSVENAALISKKFDIPLVYISTAGIFDGLKDTYNDWDTAAPLNVYGESKYQGELIVKSLLSKFFICRAGWMMGGGINKDKKFVGKILKQIKTGNKNLNVVDDKLGTPTYTYDFAKNLEKLINTSFYGTYNMVCEGLTSRYEVTYKILENLKLNNHIKLNKVDSNYFKNEYFAKRPYSERLLNTKLNLRSLNIMRNWEICLKEYLNNFYEN